MTPLSGVPWVLPARDHPWLTGHDRSDAEAGASASPTRREAVLWDGVVPGLGLHARPNGSKAWIGHRCATTTNRYPHLDDATLSEAAERVTRAIQGKLLDL